MSDLSSISFQFSLEKAILLVQSFLLDNNLVGAARALELESGISYPSENEDIQFLRELVLDARWSELEELLSLFYSSPGFNKRKVRYYILRQRLFELLCAKVSLDSSKLNNTLSSSWKNTQQTSGAASSIVTLLSELEKVCVDAKEFNSICFVLTQSNINDHPDYRNWTVHLGRKECYDCIKTEVLRVMNIPPSKTSGPPPKHQFEHILHQAAVAQTLARISADPRIMQNIPDTVPFNPLRENTGVSISADAYPIPEVSTKDPNATKAQMKIAQILSDKDGILHKLISQSSYKIDPVKHTIPVPEDKHTQPSPRSMYASDEAMHPSDRLQSTLTSLHRSSILVPADGADTPGIGIGSHEYLPGASESRWSSSVDYSRQGESGSQAHDGSYRSGGRVFSPTEDRLRTKRAQDTPQSTHYANTSINTSQNTTLLSTLRFKDLASVRTVLNADARKTTAQEKETPRYPHPVASEASVPATSPLPTTFGSELLSPPLPPTETKVSKSEEMQYSARKRSVTTSASAYTQDAHLRPQSQMPFTSPPPPIGEHYATDTAEPLNASLQSVSSTVSYRRVEAPSPRRHAKLSPHKPQSPEQPAYDSKHTPSQHHLPQSPYTAPDTQDPSLSEGYPHRRSRADSSTEPVSWVVPLEGRQRPKPTLPSRTRSASSSDSRARTPVRTSSRGSIHSPSSPQSPAHPVHTYTHIHAHAHAHGNVSVASKGSPAQIRPRSSRPPSHQSYRSQHKQRMDGSDGVDENLHHARKLSFGGAFKEQYHPEHSISETSEYETYDPVHPPAHRPLSRPISAQSKSHPPIGVQHLHQASSASPTSPGPRASQSPHTAAVPSSSSTTDPAPDTRHVPYRPLPGVVHYAPPPTESGSTLTPYSDLGRSLPSSALGSTVETFPSYASDSPLPRTTAKTTTGAGRYAYSPSAALEQVHSSRYDSETTEHAVEYVHSKPQRNGQSEASPHPESTHHSRVHSPGTRPTHAHTYEEDDSRYNRAIASPQNERHYHDEMHPQQQQLHQPKARSPYRSRPPTAPHPSAHPSPSQQQQQQVWYSPGKSERVTVDSPAPDTNTVLSGSLLSNRSFDEYLPGTDTNEQYITGGDYHRPRDVLRGSPTSHEDRAHQEQHSSVPHIAPYSIDILDDIPQPDYLVKEHSHEYDGRSPSTPDTRGKKEKDRPSTAHSVLPKGDTSRISLPRGYPGFAAGTGFPHWVASLLYNAEMENYSYDSNDEECYRMAVPNTCAKQLRDILQMDTDTVFVGSQPVRTAIFDPAPLSIHQTVPENDDLSISSLVAIGTNSKSLVFNTIRASITGRIPEHDEFSLVPGGGIINGVASAPVRRFSDHHLGSVYSTDWTYTPNDRHFSSPLVATASNDMTVKLVRLGKTPHGQLLPEASPVITLNANSGTLRSVAFLGGRTAHALREDTSGLHVAAVGGGDFSVKVWDIQAFTQASLQTPYDKGAWDSIRTRVSEPYESFHGHTNVVYGVTQFDQQGRHFATVSADGCVALWDMRIRNRIPAYLFSLSSQETGTWCLPNQPLPTQSVSNAVQLHSIAVPKPVPGIQRSLTPGSVGPREIVVGGADGRIAVVDIVAGKILLSKKSHSESIRNMDALGPLIVTASDDQSVVVSAIGDDINTIGRERLHSDKVLSARFHHELPMILTSSADKTVMASTFHVGPGSNMM